MDFTHCTGSPFVFVLILRTPHCLKVVDACHWISLLLPLMDASIHRENVLVGMQSICNFVDFCSSPADYDRLNEENQHTRKELLSLGTNKHAILPFDCALIPSANPQDVSGGNLGRKMSASPPPSDGLPKKRVSKAYTAVQKTDYVDLFRQECSESGSCSQRQFAKKHQLSHARFSAWCKEYDQLKSLDSNKRTFTRVRSTQPRFPLLEGRVLEWVHDQRTRHNTDPGVKSIQSAARSIALDLGMTDFMASNTWVERFKKRCNLLRPPLPPPLPQALPPLPSLPLPLALTFLDSTQSPPTPPSPISLSPTPPTLLTSGSVRSTSGPLGFSSGPLGSSSGPLGSSSGPVMVSDISADDNFTTEFQDILIEHILQDFLHRSSNSLTSPIECAGLGLSNLSDLSLSGKLKEIQIGDELDFESDVSVTPSQDSRGEGGMPCMTRRVMYTPKQRMKYLHLYRTEKGAEGNERFSMRLFCQRYQISRARMTAWLKQET